MSEAKEPAPTRTGNRLWLSAGLSIFLLLLGTLFCIKIPITSELYDFGIVTNLLAVFPLFLYWQSTLPSGQAQKVAGVASLVLWVVGIALAFIIPPTSFLVSVPDTFLLLGFFPVLFLWRFSLPWIIFGLFNFSLGILLQTVEYLGDDLFPKDVQTAKHHLATYHKPLPWMIIGLSATIFGYARFGRNAVIWIKKRKQS